LNSHDVGKLATTTHLSIFHTQKVSCAVPVGFAAVWMLHQAGLPTNLSCNVVVRQTCREAAKVRQQQWAADNQQADIVPL
jgi:hypothetical protein